VLDWFFGSAVNQERGVLRQNLVANIITYASAGVCGNGTLDPGEECDDGNRVDTDGCTNHCTICGNGIVTPPEQCDDGNLVDGDGCDSNCTPTGCGNGIVTAGEQCDDGNTDDSDTCLGTCVLNPACGNLTGTTRSQLIR
jgi:cysteine-rich repeat protein